MKEALRMYHENNRCEMIFKEGEPALEIKRDHIKRVVKMALVFAEVQNSKVDTELLKVVAEHKDDGRVDQYSLLGKFLDSEVTHFALGVDRVNRFLKEKNIEPDTEIDLLRNVMMYHGRENLIAKMSREEREYISIISAADDFENATSCVRYLIREADTDAKGYEQKNPEANQKKVTNDKIWMWYQTGEKFDKMLYCQTYADYILFAATLATNCIKQYNNLAKIVLKQQRYGSPTILEGFQYTFEHVLEEKDAEKAYKILEDLITQ